jgi:hypothetical protein
LHRISAINWSRGKQYDNFHYIVAFNGLNSAAGYCQGETSALASVSVAARGELKPFSFLAACIASDDGYADIIIGLRY